MFNDVRRVVGLGVDVLWLVVRFSVGTIGVVGEVESNIKVVYNFHVRLYGDVKTVCFEAFSDIFPYSFSLWSRGVFEDGKSVVSIKSDIFIVVQVPKFAQGIQAYQVPLLFIHQ